MGQKVILIPFNGHDHQVSTLEFGLDLAKAFGGHSVVRHVSYDPQYLSVPYGLYDIPAYAKEAYKEIKKINATNLQAARSKYAAALDRLDIKNSESSFQVSVGLLDEIVAEAAKTADLVVLPRPSGIFGEGEEETAMSCLFSSAHPVLLMPPRKGNKKFNGNSLIAWNGSQEAVRAVTAALPYLTCGKVRVLINYDKASQKTSVKSAQALIQYLKWHGVDADLLELSKKDSLLPQAIQEEARKMKAGMIVMGAYTHGRLRESILGGVTDYMLHNATIPLFMSH